MAIGPTGARYRRIHGNSVAGGHPSKATLTTALTGTNNDLTFTSVARGTGANAITVRYVDPGAASAALSVSVSGNAITVSLATNATSVITSTGAQVRDAVNGSAPASALVSAANATGNDGTGVVTVLAATALAGGANYVIGSGR